ncbi:hypothetical protein LJC15_00120 [Desulfovibrio sp. OttesenSCG-928-G11]|nr:hypothetical protein [Desulfovibrio sp. OttesenSCG-928-G11]
MSQTSNQTNKSNLIKITKKEWAAIHRDFKGTWTNPSSPEWIGRKYVMAACLGIYDGTLLNRRAEEKMIE